MIFDSETLAAKWNTEFERHHHRFVDVGSVIFVVNEEDGCRNLLLVWDKAGKIELNQKINDDQYHKYPQFISEARTWEDYISSGRSAAYYFALGRMRYKRPQLFLVRNGLLFDVVARCASTLS